MVQQVKIFANKYKILSSITRAQRAGESRVSAGCMLTCFPLQINIIIIIIKKTNKISGKFHQQT